MAKLVIYPGTPQTREFELKPGTNFVGRGFANDLQIEDASVSTSHAQISVNGDAVSVKDLGSTNGTFINRQAVTESGLLPGQLLRLGGVEMIFQADTAPAVAAMTSAPAAGLGTELPPIGSVHIQTPPIPPPVSARMRPVNSTPTGTVTLAREAVPPIAEALSTPSPARELVELPEGKSACKFHPKNPAQWLCDKCRTAFCSLCVTSRPTPEGAGYFCRTCGVTCLPVKIKYTVTKEKVVKEYSDVMVLVRSVGFGFGAAVLAGTIWAAVGAISDVMIFFTALLIWGTGALTGFAVKIACQDRPGVVFSLIAVGFCILGIVFGEIGLTLTTHHMAMGIYGLFATMFAMFTAWRIGGGDF